MTFLLEQFICCLILYHSLVELLLNVLASLITLQFTRLLARFLPCTLLPHSPNFQHPASPIPPSELSCSGSTPGHPSHLNLDGARCSLRFLWPLRSVKRFVRNVLYETFCKKRFVRLQTEVTGASKNI